MKKLITDIAFIFLIYFCSCKDQTYEEKMAGIYRADSIKHSEHFPSGQPNTPDTSIGQQVWYNKKGGKYVLQTWVNTNKYQYHFSKNVEEGVLQSAAYIGNMPGDAPYNVDIIGSFEYIKANKAIEYAKAVKVLDSLKVQGYAIQIKISIEAIKQKAIDDTLELLRKLK